MDAEDQPGAAPSDPKTAPLSRRVPLLWGLVALVLASMIAVGALILLRVERGPRPPFLSMPRVMSSAKIGLVPPLPDDSLGLAGSGSNLPLTHVLVEAFRARSPLAKIIVHESIGSAGGIRAVRDGAVSVGLVSRPLTSEEARYGLQVTPYARIAVIVAANPSVQETCTTSEELLRLFQGAKARWGSGSRVAVLQREKGDSSFLVLSNLIPGLAEENTVSYRENRWRVLFSDQAMQEALMSTEGAVGISDLGAIEVQRLPIKVLCFNGVVPTRENLLSGKYPAWKDLSFVTRGPPNGLAAALFDFVFSDEGRAATARSGHLPLPLEPVIAPGRQP
jgi:phosphate transport system substrate-binding protein